jgi:addiction module HigA family antidote
MISGVSASGSWTAMPLMSNLQIIIRSLFMNIENTRERKIRPTHPGEMLREDFLTDYGLTVSRLARALGVSRQTVNELLRERRALTPEMALRLARLFGNTPEFWLNAQRAVDLWDTERALKKRVQQIKPLTAA